MFLLLLSLLFGSFCCAMFCIGGAETMPAFAADFLSVQHDWLDAAALADVVALSEATPGSLGLNAATLGGYAAAAGSVSEAAAIWGSLAATVGISLPSLVSTAVVEKLRRQLDERGIRQTVMSWLRPLVPALIAAGALMLCSEANFSSPHTNPWQFWISLFLGISTLIGVGHFRIHPLPMLLLCGFAGWILF